MDLMCKICHIAKAAGIVNGHDVYGEHLVARHLVVNEL